MVEIERLRYILSGGANRQRRDRSMDWYWRRDSCQWSSEAAGKYARLHLLVGHGDPPHRASDDTISWRRDSERYAFGRGPVVAGDNMEVTIEGIGTLKNSVADE